MVNNGVWHEILLRVDPYIIFDCILVCKSWLEVITCPEFRQSYQKRWKTNSKLVGFTHGYCFNLLATSKLGRIMNENKSIQLPRDFFLTKSGEGDGLILYGSPSENMLYVSKAGENRPIRLHIPANMDANLPHIRYWLVNVPKRFYYTSGVAILSQHDSYKVVMVGRETYSDNKIIIQTYSSSTGEWQVSEPVTDLPMCPSHYGITSVMASSKRGVLYWPDGDSVTSYDANNGCISSNIESQGSSAFQEFSYGLSPEGYLRCATSSVWAEYGFNVGIFELDDDDDDNKAWKKLHSLESDSIPEGVSLVSLVPGRCDCIFVESAGVSPQLSLYNLHTRELVTVCHLPGERWDAGSVKHEWVPLTMADLGVWPSSPFSDTAKSNINTVKRLLAWDHDGDI